MDCVELVGGAERGSCTRGEDRQLSNLSSESTLTESNGLCVALDDNTVSGMFSLTIKVWAYS